MSSVTSLVARQCRVQEWTKQIQECKSRPTGMSVKEWCGQQNITPANFYYRLREVRKACLEHIPTEQLSQSIVPVPQEIFHSESKMKYESGLDISINGISIHMTENTSTELLTRVLQVITHV